MKKQLTFYFIRHGKTVWNTEGLMQGHGDSPLTEEGISGAKKTGIALNNIPFVAAYSSVLKRTIATASHITVSYTHLRAHETDQYLVCRLLLEKKKN